MSESPEAILAFYQTHLPGGTLEKNIYTADCPFCGEKGLDGTNRFVVTVNKDGFLHGFFRCLNRCVAGGFPLWFAALANIDPAHVPGYDPDRDNSQRQVDVSGSAVNQQIHAYQDNLTERLIEHFQQSGVSEPVLRELAIGYNGRYIVYPYFQEDGNCYFARCVFPDRPDDFFWEGRQQTVPEPLQLFNVQDIERCENGSIFLCEGEDNLLTLKQMGLPGIAVPDSRVFDHIEAERFAFIRTLFIVTLNNVESEIRARSLASRVGFKVRLLRWPSGLSRDYSLWQLARDTGTEFSRRVVAMVRASKAFSPFASPKREHDRFFEDLQARTGPDYAALKTGFSRLDEAIGGVHGINVIGGAPKVGKSCFLIQIATDMARRGVPVIYYDFENGRQKIYERTLVRLSRVSGASVAAAGRNEEENRRYDQACRDFRKMLNCFRVVNDRKVSPEIMRRHVDFLRHETQREYTVIVVDSLHKLPFKDFTERRTGIDAWLRQFESIRDELRVSFLIISELTRGDRGSYQEAPHMGMFKGSGDIEYSADNALILSPDWKRHQGVDGTERSNDLWLVASREYSPGRIASYRLDFPFWGFRETDPFAPVEAR